MKKIFLLAAVCALLPGMVLGFNAMEDEQLGEVTAESGLELSFGLELGTLDVRYTDPVGGHGVTNPGWVDLDNVSLTQGGGTFSFTESAPLIIDAGGDGGTNEFLYIDFPRITDYRLNINKIQIGAAASANQDFGSFSLTGLDSDPAGTVAISMRALTDGLGWAMGAHIDDAVMAWGDSNGFGTYTTAGYLKFDGITADNNGSSVPNWATISWNVHSGSDGSRSFLMLDGGPGNDFYLRSSAVRLSSSAATGVGTSAFPLTLGNLDRTGTSWQISMSPHQVGAAYGGIDLWAEIGVTDGYIQIQDTGGFGSYNTTGYLTFADLSISNNGAGRGTILDGMWIGVGEGGGTAWLVFYDDGWTMDDIEFGSVYLRTTAGESASPTEALFSLHLNDFQFGYVDVSLRPLSGGFFVDTAFQILDGTLGWGDPEGFGTFTTGGYFALNDIILSNTANNPWYINELRLNAGSNGAGDDRLQIVLNPSQSFVLGFTPTVDSTVSASTSDGLGMFRITGNISGTIEARAH